VRASSRALVFGDREERCKRSRVLGVGRGLAHPVVAGEARAADAVDLGLDVVAERREERCDRLVRCVERREADAAGVALEIVVGHGAVDLEHLRGAEIGMDVAQEIDVRRVEAHDQPVGAHVLEDQPHERAAVAAALGERLLDPAEVGENRRLLVEDVFDDRKVRHDAEAVHEPPRDVPLLAGDDHQFPVAAERRPLLPEARRETLARPSARGEEGVEAAPLVRDAEVGALRLVEFPEARLQLARLGRDLAGEKRLLAHEQVVVVVVEGDRHPVVGEHEEGGRARHDLLVGDEVPDEGLEEGLVRDPGPCGRSGRHRGGAR
jgi:hypothetical protein